MTKIIDRIKEHQKENKPFYSFEFFPPKTESGLHNLYARFDRMAGLEPLFIDVTWGAGGNIETNKLSFEISKMAKQYFGLEVMMHLTCTGMTQQDIENVLKTCKESGVSNILALRGDPKEGEEKWEACEGGFCYASELTEFIRERFGDEFGIAVGGYPEGHIECSSREEDLMNLKKKVDAGADFIVTQLFYDVDEFLNFRKRARDIGINVPIIPGILPIQNYDRFLRFTSFCQTKVPEQIFKDLEPIKHDDEQVKAYGIRLAADMCRKLRDEGVSGFHFYTLNLESSVTAILEELGLYNSNEASRALPWRPSTLDDRQSEDVRPIFWSNRPKSYLSRTMNWDDFPNGRWGDSRSPTFGNLTDYYLVNKGLGLRKSSKKRLDQWGEPGSIEDVCDVFSKFCLGKIDLLPWCELPVQNETSSIAEKLAQLNKHGYLTINSQPQVNGVLSSDSVVGWGGENGRVYQKAYIEFFVSPEKFESLMEKLSSSASISYHAVNAKGESHSCFQTKSVNAVTWGVFPGKEIVQPTVVDSDSFKIWKDEAFALWYSEWAALYEENSKSAEIIDGIASKWWLVNVVENDFVDGDIWKIFPELSN